MKQIQRILLQLAVFWAIFIPAEARTARKTKTRKGQISKQACEGETMNITCPENQVIEIIQANYGRFSVTPCNDEGTAWTNNRCTHPKSGEIMMDRCAGKRKCSVKASNEEFGPPDPCQNTYKYLDVYYRCNEAPSTTVQPEVPTTTKKQNVNPAEEKEIIPPTPEVVTKASEMVDRTEGTPEPVTEGTEVPRFCPQTSARDIEWPKTELGHKLLMACPNDPQTYAEWTCGRNGVWAPDGPDLSRCVSRWARNAEMSAAAIDSEDAALRVASSLNNDVIMNRMYGGDTVTVTNILETIVIRSSEQLKHRPLSEKKSYASRLGRILVNTGNYLIHDRNREAWKDLSEEKQIRSANNLLDSIEQNANVLAAAMRRGDMTEAVAVPNQYIIVEVTVVQIQEYAQFPSLSMTDSKVDSVRVPEEALTQNGQTDYASVVFASYKNLGEYMPPGPVTRTVHDKQVEVQRKIVSRVVTATVGDSAVVENLGKPVILTMKIDKDENLTNPSCVFWDKKLGSYGQWSSEGCKLVRSNETHAVCSCDHLTNFAVLMDVKGLDFSYEHTVILSFITYIGCVVSIVCLFMCILAFCIMRGSSSDRTTIHINLCLCLLVAEVVFIFGIPQTWHEILCSVIAGLLHYFFLAAFAWMLLEGFQLYALLVEVFETENSRKKWFYLFGYGIPAVIVGISVGVDRDGYGTERYCWLRTDNYFVLSFVGPVIVVLAANAILLAMAIVIMCRHSSMSMGYRHCQHRTTIENMGTWLKGAVVLVFLLGLTWTFGIMYINDDTVVMAYLFTVLNSLQGLFIFLFHVVLNDKMRKEYRKWVRRNDWLPSCLRDATLVEYQPANGLQKIPTHSSSHGSASSPLPPSDSTATTAPSYLGKFLQGDKTESRYNSSAQLLLGKRGSYDVSHKYDYAFVHGESESSEEGTMVSPLSNGSPKFMHFLNQMERCHPHRPPPNFPPPAPPVYQPECEEFLPDVLVQNLDGRIVFDLGNGPGKRPVSAKSSTNSADDSAYSEGSSFRSRNPGPKIQIRRDKGEDFITRDLSTSPDSVLNSEMERPDAPVYYKGAPNPKKYVVLNLPSLPNEEERDEGMDRSAILSLPDLSYEVPRSTAERISPSLLSPLPSPTEHTTYSSARSSGNEHRGYTRVVASSR